MNSEKKSKITIIPPISKNEAEKMMLNANKDVEDANKVIGGHHVNIVRPFSDKSFLKFCEDYKDIKRELNEENG